MLANLYRDEPKPLPSPHEEAILPVARLVRDEWMHTVYRGPADTDNLTQETYEKRDEYRSLMLKEPAVSAAFWSRIASVMTLVPKVHAQDPDNPAEVEVANFVKDAIGSCQGGWPHIIGSLAAGGLLDGFAVCEMVFDFPERGKWRNKRWVLKEFAPLDGRFIRFDIDSFKRVVGVRGLKANAGQVFNVDRFAIYSHQQLFNNPFGISQFRAAYRAAKMMESAIKLRIILLQNFTGPFVAFKSASPETRASAMRIVANARSQGFLVCDKNDDFTVTNMASGSDSEFQSAMDDLRKEMYTAICWGYLPFVEGREGSELGNSTVQKSITELGTWRLATGIAEVINRYVVPPLVRNNIADETINFPVVALGGQNTGDKKSAGDIFELAKRLGVPLSKKQVQRALDLEEPNGPEDELRELPQGGAGGNPFAGMPEGDGGFPPDGGGAGGPTDGAPVPGGDGGGMPDGGESEMPAAPGQPQAGKPHGPVDLSRWNPRIGKTDTAEMDRAAMIAILDLQARAHRAGSPGRFQKAIDALRAMIGNHPAMHLALAGPPDQSFGWHPEQTRTGGVKAVNDQNPKYILYGERAKLALNDHPDHPKVAQESHERYQGVLHAKGRAQELAAKLVSGGGGSSEDYKELAGHVQHLSINEIHAVRKTLMGSFSNANKRAEMVSALSQYALRIAGETVPNVQPGQPSFRAPGKTMAAKPKLGNGATPPPTEPPSAPVASAKAGLGRATGLLKDHLDASEGLTPDQWSHYHGAIEKATAKMPAAAHARIEQNLRGATFHAKSASIGDALYRDCAELSPDPQKFAGLKGQKIGVGYCTSKGTLHIDGDLRPGAGEDKNPERFGVGKYAPAHEVYAHALGRVIDGPNYEMSSSKEWGQAFTDEISHNGAQYATHKLSRFASMSPEQGFAEFSRLVYGSKVPAKEVAERFPQATAFFQKQGLLPSEGATAPAAKDTPPKLATVPATAVHPAVYTAPALSEAFDKKVVVAKDGSHVDTLKPLTEETLKPVEKKSPFGRDELKAKPPAQGFNIGADKVNIQFDSVLQQRLNNLGEKQHRAMKGARVSNMAPEVASLAAATGRKPLEIRMLANDVHKDVRGQMKGVKAGETRTIVDNHDVHGEKAKTPAPVAVDDTEKPSEVAPTAPKAEAATALAETPHAKNDLLDAAMAMPDAAPTASPTKDLLAEELAKPVEPPKATAPDLNDEVFGKPKETEKATEVASADVAKPTPPPFAHGTKETAESVLDRVKASPNQPADRDWDAHAQQHGIEGDFTHVELPTKTLTENVFAGHLRRSNSVDQSAVEKKIESGDRNPVLITKEPGRGSLVVDGNHSLAAAMQAGDPTVQAIVSEKSPLHPKGEPGDDAPVQQVKDKRKTAAVGDSLGRVVASYGGIDPKSLAFLAHYSGAKEAVENGLPPYIFKNGGRGLDELAQELHTAGHISVPGRDADGIGGDDAGAHLLEQIANKAKSHHADLSDHYEKALQDHWKLEEEARKEHEESHIAEANRVGQAAGASTPQEHLDAETWEEFEHRGESDAAPQGQEGRVSGLAPHEDPFHEDFGKEPRSEATEPAVEHDPHHQAVAKRFGIPVEAVKSIVDTHPDELAKRDSYIPPSSGRDNAVGPTTNFEKHPLGTAKIDETKQKLGDTDDAYVDYLREFDPHKLQLAEHEDGMSKSGSVEAYTDWMKQGIEAPPVNVFDSSNGNGELVSANRRRVLAARAAGTTLKGWHGVNNKETGLPLKYGDVKRALAEAKGETAPAVESPMDAADDTAKPRGLKSTSTAQRDIFGGSKEGPKAVKKGQQLSLDDANRDLWDQKAHEYAAEQGHPIEAKEMQKFKMNGQWYQVGKQEDGFPITPTESLTDLAKKAKSGAAPTAKIAEVSSNKVEGIDPRTMTADQAEEHAKSHFQSGGEPSALFDKLSEMKSAERSAFNRRHGLSGWPEDEEKDYAKLEEKFGSEPAAPTNEQYIDPQAAKQAEDADAIPRVSNDDFASGGWDQTHAGLTSEAVAVKMALGMKGIEGREYGIRKHAPGKWQMVSKPMGAGASAAGELAAGQAADAVREHFKKADSNPETEWDDAQGELFDMLKRMPDDERAKFNSEHGLIGTVRDENHDFKKLWDKFKPAKQGRDAVKIVPTREGVKAVPNAPEKPDETGGAAPALTEPMPKSGPNANGLNQPTNILPEGGTNPKVPNDKLESTGQSRNQQRVSPRQPMGDDARPSPDSVLPQTGGGTEPVGGLHSVSPGSDEPLARRVFGDGGPRDDASTSPRIGDASVAADPAGRNRPSRGVGEGSRDVRPDGRNDAILEQSGAEASLAQPSTPENPTASGTANFKYDSTDFLAAGPKAKFAANVAAIRTMQAIAAEGRTQATPEEQQILSRWTGWGQFPQAFNYGDQTWNKEREQLRGLLSNEEWDAAKKSTLNAHYTSPDVVKAHWKMAQRLGFGGGRYLETSAGIGYYLGMMPPEIAGKTRATAIELEPTTGGMLKHLYPGHNVKVQGFQEHKLKNFYDLVASNVPFGDYGVHDPEYNKHGANIHDYFFLKSADAVRPGGLVMHITSTGTLDKADPKIREELAKTCDLVSAVRFPGSAHKQNAGTDVVTDMLVLRKRLPGEEPGNRDWLETTTVPDPAGGEPIPVNKHFANNPHLVLGTLDRTGTMYRGDSVNVSKTPDYEQRLEAAIQSMPEGIFKKAVAPKERFTLKASDTTKAKQGGYVVQDGKLHIKDGDELIPQQAEAKHLEKVAGHIEVRDAMRGVINAQLESGDTDAARKKLNAVYDGFVKKHGFLNEAANRKAFAADPDSPVLLAMEKYDPKSKKATKADIFHKNTIRSDQKITSVGSPSEALGVSLHETGGVDIDRMSALTGVPADKLGQHLVEKGLAFQDPSHGWQHADHYLSGNVRKKLALARSAAESDPSYKANVAALEKVQPEDVEHADIEVKLGASWVPATDIANFAAELLDGNPEHFEIKHIPHSGAWVADFSRRGGVLLAGRRGNREVWGTARKGFMDLLEPALNNQTVTVYDRGPDNESIVNRDETDNANAKIQEIKDKFKEWVWNDDERRGRLHRSYNDQFNNTVPMKYNGAHQTFPGMNPDVELRPHQKDFVWQTVTTGKGLAAHEVGTGKTYSMVAAAMELRRLGLAKKPAVAVLKSMIEQFTNEARHLYPGAKILAVDKFDAANRKKIISQMATGDYDMLVLTHDNLDMLQMKPETVKAHISEELRELEEAKLAAEAEGGNKKGNRVVKQLEKAKERLNVRLQDALDASKKDDAVFFEETGIDHLFVDEAHKYKSLPVYTKQDRLKGVPTSRSDRATAMKMRTQWLMENNNGRGVTFATGTPVANTMAELYNMQRYLQSDELKERNLHSFDSWASVFGDVHTKMEHTVTGDYKSVSRFARFVNIPELMQSVRQIMDVQRATSMADKEGNSVINRPKRKDTVIKAPETPDTKALMASLKRRAEELKYDKESKDNMLVICTDGRKGALDMRLLDRNAEDHPDSKVNQAIRNVLDISKKNPGKTQMIFSDIGVNPSKDGFHLYEDMIDKLVAGGIPREKIADFSKLEKKKKEDAMQDMREGKILVALGSTDKMGTGVNVQHKLIALHHLDVPWLPASVEQRDGRGWRQQNENKEIGIHRYVTEGSLDQTFWQTIDNKSRFIKQVMTPTGGVGRVANDEDTEELSPEQLMAAASGDPRIMEKVQLHEDLRNLTAAEKRHQNEQMKFRDSVTRGERNLPILQERAANARKDAAHVAKHPDFALEIGNNRYEERKDAAEAFAKALESTNDKYGYGAHIGKLRGMDIKKVGEKVEIHAPSGERYPSGATLGSVEYVLRNLDKHAADAEADVERSKADVDKVRENIGKAFPKANELATKRERLVELENHLRGRHMPDGVKEGDTVTLGDGRSVKVMKALDKKMVEVEHEGKTTQVSHDQFPKPA